MDVTLGTSLVQWTVVTALAVVGEVLAKPADSVTLPTFQLPLTEKALPPVNPEVSEDDTFC